MSRDHHHEDDIEDELEEQSPCLPWRVYEGSWQESMPVGFDGVTIHLDGRVQSELNWKKEKEEALKAIENGFGIMWNMEMGLFHELIHPLTNQGQFLSLTLALEHFRDSVWQEFKTATFGLTLFHGSADFNEGFQWDEHQEQNLRSWLHEINASDIAALELSKIREHKEGKMLLSLYCRDVTVEYLALLATRLPDTLPIYLFLDTGHLSPHTLLSELQLLNPERFDRLQLALRGHQLPFQVIGWNQPTAYGYSGLAYADLPDMVTPAIGICIPPMHFYHSYHYKGLEDGMRALQQKSVPFKLIAESYLTAQWDGLDYLFYSPTGLTAQGKRKLQGFCAAGGTVVSVGDLIGLPNEMSLQDWMDSRSLD